jgi:hypothetical protein
VNSLSMFNFNPKFKRKRIFLYYRSTSWWWNSCTNDG